MICRIFSAICSIVVFTVIFVGCNMALFVGLIPSGLHNFNMHSLVCKACIKIATMLELKRKF
jgi:hypothetical protein